MMRARSRPRRLGVALLAFALLSLLGSCDFPSYPYYFRKPPINLAIALDKSLSMEAAFGSTTRLGAAREAAIELVNGMKDGDTLSVVLFGNSGSVLVDTVRLDESTRAAAVTAIRSVRAEYGNTVSEGLRVAYAQVRKNLDDYHFNTTVLVCDGDIDAAAQGLAREAAASGLRTCAIGLGESSREALDAVASAGSGSSFFASSRAELAALMVQAAYVLFSDFSSPKDVTPLPGRTGEDNRPPP